MRRGEGSGGDAGEIDGGRWGGAKERQAMSRRGDEELFGMASRKGRDGFAEGMVGYFATSAALA